MKVLLDTHTFLWFINGDEKISPTCRRTIEDVSNERLLSIATVWEMAIKVITGRLSFDGPFEQFIEEQLRQNRIHVPGITLAHTARVVDLPYHHRDPFDRLLIAQALVEDIPILSIDRAFDAYGVARLW